jgi:hypothetical protein
VVNNAAMVGEAIAAAQSLAKETDSLFQLERCTPRWTRLILSPDLQRCG